MKSLSLAVASLVPLSHVELAAISKVPHSEDLVESPIFAKIMLHKLAQHWDLDFTKVKISGFLKLEGKADDLKVRVLFRDRGEINRDLNFEGLPFGGEITVEGEISAIGRDLGQELAQKWLDLQGFPSDYPVDVLSTVTATGVYRVEVIPCA